MDTIRRHHISFKNAASGIIYALKTQPNFRIHLSLALVAILAGFYLDVSFVEMTVLIFAIFFGLGMEMVNTSIESMTDLIATEWKKDAKTAKDVSAGMMLLSAFGTVLIAALIFLPKILERFQ